MEKGIGYLRKEERFCGVLFVKMAFCFKGDTYIVLEYQRN
jgi:hypothetical protein